MSLRRIKKELADLRKEPLPNMTAAPINENEMFYWAATLNGPPDTPYTGGVFQLKIDFSNNYPFKPPEVYFLTKVYHPNVSPFGSICLDILKSQWSPALTVSRILLSISALLCDPNPSDPLVGDVARVYLEDRSLFDKTAKEWTRLYAYPGANQTTISRTASNTNNW